MASACRASSGAGPSKDARRSRLPGCAHAATHLALGVALAGAVEVDGHLQASHTDLLSSLGSEQPAGSATHGGQAAAAHVVARGHDGAVLQLTLTFVSFVCRVTVATRAAGNRHRQVKRGIWSRPPQCHYTSITRTLFSAPGASPRTPSLSLHMHLTGDAIGRHRRLCCHCLHRRTHPPPLLAGSTAACERCNTQGGCCPGPA